MANKKQRFSGSTYRSRQMSYAVQQRSTTYFDFLRTLNDEELRKEYKYVYSYTADVKRKRIINKFLMENDKLDIIR